MRFSAALVKDRASESSPLLSAGLRISCGKHRRHLQRATEFHFLFYFMNDRALLVLQHTVTHHYREVLCRFHMPTGTLKSHPAS